MYWKNSKAENMGITVNVILEVCHTIKRGCILYKLHMTFHCTIVNRPVWMTIKLQI